MKIFLSFLFFFNTAYASYPELFGASFSTSGIGNQANFDLNDPSNNYYSPSLLGFSHKFNVLAQATNTMTKFKSIKNIVVTNSTNSSSAATTGNAKVDDYPQYNGGSFHTGIPVGGEKHLGTIGLSVFMPIGSLVETNSGDPFLPEYVMYKSRYQRTSSYINFAKKWDETLAWSLGVHIGFQASAEMKSNFSLNGASYGSWARAQTQVDPALAVIASFTKRFEKSAFYFTYQQEMKSNIKTSVYGEITNPSIALVDSQLTSMMFYDPHTFRFGTTYNWEDVEIFSGVEYQMWTNYKTPIVNVGRNGGVVVPSSSYEKIETRDTINPKVGTKIHLTNRWATLLGAAYRMTPFKGDFSGSGNSVDVDSYIATAGLQYRMVIWSKDVHVGTSLQYHKLKDRKVTKTSGQENGTAGDKIGSPGYNLGGTITVASLGVIFNF